MRDTQKNNDYLQKVRNQIHYLEYIYDQLQEAGDIPTDAEESAFLAELVNQKLNKIKQLLLSED